MSADAKGMKCMKRKQKVSPEPAIVGHLPDRRSPRMSGRFLVTKRQFKGLTKAFTRSSAPLKLPQISQASRNQILSVIIRDVSLITFKVKPRISIE